MKQLNKFSRAIVAIVMMLGVSLSTLAHDFDVGGIYYNILDETAKTVKVTYSGSSYDAVTGEYTGDVVIPNSATYSGITYSVTSIGEWAFWWCTGLTEVTIPTSVTYIGDSAFYWCSGLTEVTIGNSVTSIGNSAFRGCAGLTTVNFNATNCTFMGSSNYPVFANCSNLSTLNIGENVTNIPNYAFNGCSGLTTVNFNATNCTSMGS